MINELGCDVVENIEEFFQKLISWKNEEKPSSICMDTAKKFVKMMAEKPKCLSVFEETIIIEYDYSIIEVKDNVGEFCFWKAKNDRLL